MKEEPKPKEEIKDREGPLVDKELPPNEPVIKKLKEKPRQASPEDKSLHMNLTEAEITSVKVFHDKLVRIERMLEYLVIYAVTDLEKILPEPNIRDILEEIAAGAREAVKVPPKEKKDEVPADS